MYSELFVYRDKVEEEGGNEGPCLLVSQAAGRSMGGWGVQQRGQSARR